MALNKYLNVAIVVAIIACILLLATNNDRYQLVIM